MRYKDLMTRKVDELENAFTVLVSLLSSGAPREQVITLYEKLREKMDEMRTLLNTEQQD